MELQAHYKNRPTRPRQIDSLEAKAQDVLRFISSCRNLFRPINRLPLEILSLIARDVVKGDSDVVEMVPLTHVCRHWRQSLISIPENWTLISDVNEHMAAVCLQRAKAAPLEITLFSSSLSESPLFPRIIEPYVHNARTLEARYILTVEHLTAIFPDFPRSMPMLESISLRPTTEESQEGNWSINPFEPGFAHTLKHLSLTGIPLYPTLIGIRTLTELTLHWPKGDICLDTLLDFLEGNNSLESADLSIEFTEPPPHNPIRRVKKNQLRHLSIRCNNIACAQALITTVSLRRGAALEIEIRDENATLVDTLPNVSTAHLLDPPLPTSFEFTYRWHDVLVGVLLRGPGGKFSFSKCPRAKDPFPDIHLLPLTNAREFRLLHFEEAGRTVPEPPVFRPSLFPSLETLAIECNPKFETDVRRVLSSLLLNPTSSSLLKTLAFLNCTLSEELMEEITKFASERKKTLTSTWLYRVLIVHKDGEFLSAASIHKLKNYVRVVEARMGSELPEDLT